MTNEMQATTESPSIAFGARLQTAREALGLGTKDAAARLRLNEKVILMMEKERYADDLPITFIRGYIRAYGKLLQIPDHEVKKALEPITAKPTSMETEIAKKTIKPTQPVTSDNYSMRISTYFIVLTMFGLVGAWWYSHSTSKDTTTTIMAESQLLPVPSDTIQSKTPPLALNPSPPVMAQDPKLAETEINVNPKSGQTTIIHEQPDGQAHIIEDKSAATTAGPQTVQPRTKKVPVEDINDQYPDNNTD